MTCSVSHHNILFTDRQRLDSSPKINRESDFEFLDRSARLDMERVCQFLEALVTAYPTHEQAELVACIRSGNDTHFKLSIFELILNDHPDIRELFKDFVVESTDIRYTVGGGAGVERSEVVIFSWDVKSEPAGLF